MSAHGSRIKYSEKCQHHNPAAFINNGGLSAMPRHLLAGSRRHRVGAWGSQCTDSVLPLALHGCGLWPRKTRAAAWRFIVAGMAAGTPRALPRDLLWREDGSTPCGTRTRNLRIRSPTPCPLGQGGLRNNLFCIVFATLIISMLLFTKSEINTTNQSRAKGAK